MFHRLPVISVATAAIAVLALLLFMLSPSSPSLGTAHASHGSSLPEVSIASITPEVGEEDENVRVTLRLNRELTDDEKFCYPGKEANEDPRDEVCIEGGIQVADTFNDHLPNVGGPGASDNMIKFIFRNSETEKRLSVRVENDDCITPGRTMLIRINTSFDNSDTYGYTIDESPQTVPVHGNDDDNGNLGAMYDSSNDQPQPGTCPNDGTGVTEDVIANYAPAFSGRDITLSVAENTEAGEEIGNAVTATDPDEDDTLEYSLTGTDAASFDIDPDTGQIETSADLDYENPDHNPTYHVAVSVSDSMDIYGDSDMTEDDSIDVTINVTDVNEPPEFDAGVPTELNVVENTAAGEDVGEPVTATDPENGTVSYSLDDGDGAAFDIDANGQIQTKASLMDEGQATYTVTITASDNDNNEATHEVTITVTDANDPPVFSDVIPEGETSITRSVVENTVAGQPVGEPVAATDEENDSLTYSLDDQGGTNFDIDSSGQIKTKKVFDYETRHHELQRHRVGPRREGHQRQCRGPGRGRRHHRCDHQRNRRQRRA